MAYHTLIAVTTGTTNILVPDDFNVNGNSVECVGSGGGGSDKSGTSGGYGGGGGAYAKKLNVNLTPSSSCAVQVGAASGTNKTYVKDSGGTTQVEADFGTSGIFGTVGTGGLAAGSTGTTTYSGGDGRQNTTTFGGGGGGAAGPNGAGGNAPSPAGGTGDGGTLLGGTNGFPGVRGTQWGATYGVASGSGSNVVGTNFGGGAGGRRTTGSGAIAGSDGLIIIQYNPAVNAAVCGYALTGQALTFKRSLKLTCVKGTFAFQTNILPGTRFKRSLICHLSNVGFAFVGYPNFLNPKMPASSGPFQLVGRDLSFFTIKFLHLTCHGIGSVEADLDGLLPAACTVTGTSGAAFGDKAIAHIGGTFSGVGTLSGALKATAKMAMSCTGFAQVDIVYRDSFELAATIHGTSSWSARLRNPKNGSISVAGVGSFSAAMKRQLRAGCVVHGISSWGGRLPAIVSPIGPSPLIAVGVGSMSAGLKGSAKAQTSCVGTSGANLHLSGRARMGATIHGVGSVVMDCTGAAYMSFTSPPPGGGDHEIGLVAEATFAVAVSAVSGWNGHLRAAARMNCSASGVGSLAMVLKGRCRAGLTIHGVGSVSISGGKTGRTLLTIHGTSSVSAVLKGSAQLGCVVHGAASVALSIGDGSTGGTMTIIGGQSIDVAPHGLGGMVFEKLGAGIMLLEDQNDEL